MQDSEALVPTKDASRAFSRRDLLRAAGAAAASTLVPRPLAFAITSDSKISQQDQLFLDELERRACLFFWEQASPNTGQILDRARCDLHGARDPRSMASIASTGFGLSALCIADKRGYLPHAQIVERVRTTLDWHLNKMPEVHGLFYHFTHLETGQRWAHCEVSSIDTSILLCGALTAKAYFEDEKIQSMAQQIYERVYWPWLLNDGKSFSMGWRPETGFIRARWNHYCELMMIYLLAIGWPTHPIPPEFWNAFTRPTVKYAGYEYISAGDPLFTDQFSHAWFDFRNRRDAYADYFENSVVATRAHKAFCLAHPEWYSEDYWGVSASDYSGGYIEWGGPPNLGPLDGTVVPCAAAGSLPFLPEDCLAVLRAMRARWGQRAWGRYGFVDAFHPAVNWYDADVIGIDQGISLLMAENLRTGLVWDVFMRNAESRRAMQLAGFKPEDKNQMRLAVSSHAGPDVRRP